MARIKVRAVAAAATLLVSAGAVPTTAAAAVPSSFTITGSGFGHGVGMPQYGAYELSRRGASALEILDHYYTNTGARFRDTPPIVAVQLHGPDPYGNAGLGDTVTSTAVTIDGGRWRVRGPNGVTLVQGIGGRTLTASTSGTQAKLSFAGKSWTRSSFVLEWAGTRYFRPDGNKAVVSIKGTHGEYRHGRMRITARQGIPNIVNDLRLNTEYLYGIAEMPSSWGLTWGARALRAQAITARSYALTKMDARKWSCGCHVVDDVRDQNFSGWLKENEGNGYYGAVWKAAVDATTRSITRGRVLTHGGTPVAAHYFSSSGGRTANSEDVWSAVVPYERSVADPYSLAAPGNSYVSWKRTMTQARARALFALHDVAQIRVTARYESGQVKTIRGTSSTGATRYITGKADVLRAKIGAHTTAGSLPSAWISKTANN